MIWNLIYRHRLRVIPVILGNPSINPLQPTPDNTVTQVISFSTVTVFGFAQSRNVGCVMFKQVLYSSTNAIFMIDKITLY
jgi:hypothetical protein